MSFVDEFVDWAHFNLFDSEEAIDFLRGRGVSIDQCIKHKIGYIISDFAVNPELDSNHSELCQFKEHKGSWCDSCRFARWSAAWIEVEGEPLRVPVMGRRIVGYIVLPLTSYAGTILGFQIRSITEKSYDTFMLKERPEGYFFGIGQSIDSIWSTKTVWIVEGPFDHLILERLVVPNVIALTTSSPGKTQINFFRRFCKTLNSCLDKDKAGTEGFEKILKFNSDLLTINKIDFPLIKPGNKDLNDFWKVVGDDEFRSYFQKKVLPKL